MAVLRGGARGWNDDKGEVRAMARAISKVSAGKRGLVQARRRFAEGQVVMVAAVVPSCGGA